MRAEHVACRAVHITSGSSSNGTKGELYAGLLWWDDETTHERSWTYDVATATTSGPHDRAYPTVYGIGGDIRLWFPNHSGFNPEAPGTGSAPRFA